MSPDIDKINEVTKKLLALQLMEAGFLPKPAPPVRNVTPVQKLLKESNE